MSVNVGKIDRYIRIAVGILLLALVLLGDVSGGKFWFGLVVGVVLLATAGMKFCPAYRLLGFNTCRI